ncbi:MAG: MarR family transcriptional regulator [Betaproteobacteria bacterium]|nr:MarR family transcriptional regulator [Betaproteobacteria bacterium]
MTSSRMDSHRWDSALDPQVVPLFLALQWAHARSLDSMRPPLVRHGLSLAEFDVLATLRNTPPPHEATPSRIQDAMVITSGGLTKLMHQLEGRGLVRRLQFEDDLRVKPVRLTPKGARLIEAAMAEAVGLTGDWIKRALDATQIELLTALLTKCVQAPVR